MLTPSSYGHYKENYVLSHWKNMCSSCNTELMRHRKVRQLENTLLMDTTSNADLVDIGLGAMSPNTPSRLLQAVSTPSHP